MMLAPHPFGHEITPDTLIERFGAFQQWEDRYRQLIMLAKALPPLDDQLKVPEIELSGCENRVWLGYQRNQDGSLHFYGDSEGRIVKGLLAILLTAVEGLMPQAILASDPLALDLRRTLFLKTGTAIQSNFIHGVLPFFSDAERRLTSKSNPAGRTSPQPV